MIRRWWERAPSTGFVPLYVMLGIVLSALYVRHLIDPDDWSLIRHLDLAGALLSWNRVVRWLEATCRSS